MLRATLKFANKELEVHRKSVHSIKSLNLLVSKVIAVIKNFEALMRQKISGKEQFLILKLILSKLRV